MSLARQFQSEEPVRAAPAKSNQRNPKEKPVSEATTVADTNAQHAFDMYGRIKEGVHIAGYSFERACSHLEWLLDENRWQLSGRFSDVNEFLDSVKLDQFRIVTDQRKRIAQRIKELQPEASNVAIAKTLGVSESAVRLDIGSKKQSDKSEQATPAPPKTRPLAAPVSDKSETAKPVSQPIPQAADLGGAAVAKLIEAKAEKDSKVEAKKAELAEVAARPVVLPEGKFGTIVIDPPWPMEKIEREVRPNQVAFDYPTMTEEQLVEFGLKVAAVAAPNCHLFMWTTQKFLPMALRLLDAWSFRYVLTMVWHKPGGFQPIGLPQYNCEFVIYARAGTPTFVDTKAFNVCFEAPRREHSRKPDEFYDLIRRVTGDGRIDIFSREPREGFAQLGNEVGKFGEAA